MKNLTLLFFTSILLIISSLCNAQDKIDPLIKNNAGWFSLGARSTLSLFDHDGAGLGSGGQFRIQLSNRVNTDWFADYISINVDDKVRSDYYHIGWSVLFYPIQNQQNTTIQPYIVAGHCFDYNKKTSIQNPANTFDRWGSAVQAGLGAHINLTDRFDISLTSQYMIHLTQELEVEIHEDSELHIHEHEEASLEGHLLTTVSLNYKIFKLWKR